MLFFLHSARMGSRGTLFGAAASQMIQEVSDNTGGCLPIDIREWRGSCVPSDDFAKRSEPDNSARDISRLA